MNDHRMLRSTARWLKFNLVGAGGIGMQLAMLWALTGLGVGYLLATALAVEAAVLHNFFWHERFTWADRTGGRGEWAVRLVRFNLSTGGVSIGGNLLLMWVLVEAAHLRGVVANLCAIIVCSLLNFIVSDRWVFRSAV